MGGHIDVESTLGHGTTFTFTLQTKVSHQSLRTYVTNNISSLEGKKILIIEDNLTNRNVLRTQLEHWKVISTVASSGKEALTLLSQIKDFDLVLTDMQMPEMDGFHLATSIRQQYPNLPIILLSSIGDDRFNDHPELFSSVLTKPVKQTVLCKHIIAQLRKEKLIEESPEPKNKLHPDFSQRFPMRILIVEDNPVNQKLTERVLSKLGYQSEIATNGLEALEAVKKQQYDLVLMDVQMPEMDGLEATRLIRKLLSTQPIIIAMTANAMQGDREACLQAGMDDYISKPVKMDALVNLLEKWALQRVKVI